MTGTGRRRGEPAAEEDYRTEQFSFVDEDEAQDVIDWLAFTETRTERREERRRRSRYRFIAFGVVLGLLLLAGGGYALTRALSGGEGAGASDRTAVLFQVRGPGGKAVASAVVLDDAAAQRTSVLVVPATLGLEPAGTEPTTVAAGLAGIGPSQTRDAVGDMLGVSLDGSWILEDVAFASLVERLGGIDAIVDAPVAVPGAAAVPPGKRQLNGDAALAYALKRGTGEAEKAQLTRFQRVLEGVFRSMPVNAPDSTRLLDLLGVIPDPALSNERLGAALARVAQSADAAKLGAGTLPARADGGIDARAGGPVVRQLLGGSVNRARSGGPPRVLVEDGSGRRPAGDDGQRDAAARLIGGGYRYVNGGKAPKRVRTTVVQVADSVPEAQRVGEQVALTLAVPTTAVRVVPGAQAAADIVVLVGDDFRS